MKGKCYYCNKELTERTIKRHMKSCTAMKKNIEEKTLQKGRKRKQFIISVKPKYEASEYCIYLSIDASLGLVHIDQFIRDVWVECCGHLSGFTINREFYQDDDMNIKISEVLSVGEKFEYEYDFGSTTYLNLEVVDVIDVSKEFTQIEIIARNNEIEYKCEKCGEKAKYFNHEESEWLCENCINEEADFIDQFDYCNSPRDGVCGYRGDKESENKYLPGNTNKYKLNKKKVKKQENYDNIFDYDEDLLRDLLSVEDLAGKFQKDFENTVDELFTKGKYSFEISDLIKGLNKDDLYEIADGLRISDIRGLKKKELTDRILSEYEEAVGKIINLFDEERYKFLKKYADNSGVQVVNQDDENEIDKIQYFFSKGILFASRNNNDKPVMLMPAITQNLIKEKNNLEYRKLIKENSEIINLYRGMNRAYGIVSLNDIEKLFSRYGLEEAKKLKIEEILREAEYYYDEYEKIEDYLVNSEIAMWWMLLAEIEGENLEYTTISKEELLSMAEEDWIHKSKAGKTFAKEFINLFDIDKETLSELTEALAIDIQDKDMEEILDEILESLGEADKNNQEARDAIVSIVGKFIRNIRLWKYRGATINEKVGNAIKEEKKRTVGRNEPCICGSGKKYKNCCGKNGNVIQLF
ncbi:MULTISPECIES: SEC-C metal-binding domain-containing protein [unclassified Clostridium]|uniref:YecA family protein n=1 Tax=unclassified Clostridium TaxID=2614128 RepID=UPI0002986C14|nr:MULTISPECIES: SEC-C metal-binding domain-containing protein [unclassified Clostridium]EKQ52284.1 MAG: SEC-C motif domain protein [Clostridium sp. Maddingley MBC34-26]